MLSVCVSIYGRPPCPLQCPMRAAKILFSLLATRPPTSFPSLHLHEVMSHDRAAFTLNQRSLVSDGPRDWGGDDNVVQLGAVHHVGEPSSAQRQLAPQPDRYRIKNTHSQITPQLLSGKIWSTFHLLTAKLFPCAQHTLTFDAQICRKGACYTWVITVCAHVRPESAPGLA